MNGVNACGQYLIYYSIRISRKSFKLWKRVYFKLIELGVVNDMVVYFHKNPNIASTRRAYKYFREALAHELAQELSDAKETIHNENADVFASCQSKEIFRLKGKIFVGSKYSKRGRSVKCGYEKNQSKKYKDKKTSQFCDKCSKFICKECF